MPMPRLTVICMLLALTWPPASVHASLDSATVSPETVSAPFNRPGTLTLRWTVTAGTASPAPVLAQSPGLQIFAPGGRVLGQVPRLLQGTVPPGGSAVLTETVQLPRSLLQTLHSARDPEGNPFPFFEVRRTFSGAISTVMSSPANLFLTGGGGGGVFDIARLALNFEDQSTVGLIPRGDRLHAVLEVQFTGSGQLAGRWEIADPASTAGQPMFRPLRLERTSLVGAQTLRIHSPELPTDLEGAYLLRFQVTSPRTDFDPVIIRYLVTGQRPHEQPPLNLRAERPRDGALVDRETTFAWHADRAAAAYQLEIFRQPPMLELMLPALGGPVERQAALVEDVPVTGMQLPGDRRSTALSALVLQRLEPGRGYWWRVRAFGADGRVIGESPLQEFWTP
jgi:hypothetical protein